MEYLALPLRNEALQLGGTWEIAWHPRRGHLWSLHLGEDKVMGKIRPPHLMLAFKTNESRDSPSQSWSISILLLFDFDVLWSWFL